MSTASRVPETALMPGEDFTVDRARAVLGSDLWQLLKCSFIRFRYGDGFSHARAVALQMCLSLIPLALALIGLADALGHETVGTISSQIVTRLTPGRGDVVDDLVTQIQRRPGDAGKVALLLGLVTAVSALTTAMAQIERGANRIYGIQRDRPALAKYRRALVLTVTAGLPALLGFLVLVGGDAVGQALAVAYHWGDDIPVWWTVLRWPLGLLLTWGSYTVLLARAPNRRQPSYSWLATGGLIAILLWLLVTFLLTLYVGKSIAFRSTYGPLTSVLALLIWANLTAVALLFGAAFCAQMEAVRGGSPGPTVFDDEAACTPTGERSDDPVADLPAAVPDPGMGGPGAARVPVPAGPGAVRDPNAPEPAGATRLPDPAGDVERPLPTGAG